MSSQLTFGRTVYMCTRYHQDLLLFIEISLKPDPGCAIKLATYDSFEMPIATANHLFSLHVSVSSEIYR